MKTILCPVDLMEESQLATEWATKLALKRNWKLILFHKFLVSTENFEDSDDPYEAAKRESEEKLLDLQESLCKKYNEDHLNCNIDIAFGVETEELILKSAEKGAADLIVMGTRGAENFGDLIGGSNTTNVIDQTDIPVLVIPDSSGTELPSSIVYATDLKDEDTVNLRYVLNFAKDLNADITFLHLREKEERTSLAELEKRFSMRIVRASSGLQPLTPISFDEVESENKYQTLEEYVTNNGAGMIVVGRHPKSFFEKLLHKSDLTRDMALYSSVPVLVLQKKKHHEQKSHQARMKII